MTKKTGLLFAGGAAIFFGMAGITGKLASACGGNPITLPFYRNLISLPMLHVILKAKKIDLSLTKRECFGLLLLGLLGGFITNVLMYTSYTMISVGLTTCAHFSFPVILAMIYAVFFKEKLSRLKIVAMVLGVAGMLFFIETDAHIESHGITVALLSGFTYALYMIVMDRMDLKSMNGYKLSYYCCVFSSIGLGVYGLLRGYSFRGVLGSGAVFYLVATAVLISVLGSAMIPYAVASVGATVTGIMGVLEPVTSVLLGVLILEEPFGLRNAIGAGLVLSATVLIGLEKEPTEESQIVEGI